MPSLNSKIFIFLSGIDIEAIGAHYKKEFTEALEDNLNTPAALAVMWTLANDKETLWPTKTTLLDFDKVLGLGMETWIRDAIPEEVLTLAHDQRQMQKLPKDWTKADSIRVTKLQNSATKSSTRAKILRVRKM